MVMFIENVEKDKILVLIRGVGEAEATGVPEARGG
jgi:hypothetical protein